MYDVIIIGAGSMGSAASYFLAKQGNSVLCIDAFDPPHTEGSHHGETRIIRYAYGEGTDYVKLALRAGQLWQELEHTLGEQLLLQTGVLNMANMDAAFLQNVEASARLHNIPIEALSAADVTARFSGITLPDDMRALYEASSGVLRVEACVAGYRQLAEAAGAHMRVNEPVTAIEHGDVQRVTTIHQTYEAKKIIVCAGAYCKDLLAKAHIHVPLSPTRKTFAWFDAPALYDAAHFPAFVLERDNYCYYGFPNIDGAGYKIGRHDSGDAIDAHAPLTPFNEEDLIELEYFLTTYMPHVGELKFGKECKYNMTPDEHFIIDTLPTNDRVIIATGFSGHGFKFSSAIGELLAMMATNEPIPYDLSRFSMTRFS